MKEEDSIKLISLYEKCKEYNWDGEGAYSITFDTVNKVREFLSCLPAFVIPPEFIPEPNGSIGLEWKIHTPDGKPTYIVISIEAPSKIIWTCTINGKNYSNGKVFSEKSFIRIIECFLECFKLGFFYKF